MYQNPGGFRAHRHLPPDILSDVLPVQLPRGLMDIRLRITCYPNGSRALELQDADGRPFYWPTMAHDLDLAAALLPAAEADALVVAVKPSSLRNGMAAALTEAGILRDLEIEMPADRHFVRLMAVDVQRVNAAAAAVGARIAAAAEPYALAPLMVPPGWRVTVARIVRAFRQHGKAIREADAMLAWAAETRSLAATPAPLPPSAEAIHDRLAAQFRPVSRGSPPST